MSKALPAIISALLLPASLLAQAPATHVVGHYGGLVDVLCARPLPDGDILLGGQATGARWDADPLPETSQVIYTDLAGLPYQCQFPFMQRLRPDGQVVWTKGFGAGMTSSVITQMPDGGIEFWLYSKYSYDADPGPGTFVISPSPGEQSDALIGLNANGNLIHADDISAHNLKHWHRISRPDGSYMLVYPVFESLDLDPGPGVAMFANMDQAADLALAIHDVGGNLTGYKHYTFQGQFEGAYPARIYPHEDGSFSLLFVPTDSVTYVLGQNPADQLHLHDQAVLIKFAQDGTALHTLPLPLGNLSEIHFDRDGSLFVSNNSDLGIHHYNADFQLTQTYPLDRSAIGSVVETNGLIWVSGRVWGPTDIDLGAATVMVGQSGPASFIATLDPGTGAVKWAGEVSTGLPTLFEMADDEVMAFLPVEAAGLETGDVDPGPAVVPYGDATETAVHTYLVRMRQDALPAPAEVALTAYPNPLQAEYASFTLMLGDLSGSGTIELFDPAGRRIHLQEYTDASTVQITLPEVAGLYLARASNGALRGTTRVIRR